SRMRHLLFCSLPVLLCGCSLLLPRHDPQQVWIELMERDDDRLQALQVDGRTLDHDRYFQVPPGRHVLQVRLRFEEEAGNVGSAQPMPRTCLLTIDHDAFVTGQRY